MSDAVSPEPTLNLRSLQELFNDSPEDYEPLVDGMLPLGATSLLVAKPKVGKTTTAETLIYAVATGMRFLGRETRQGSVLYLQLEASAVETASHFKKMGATGQEAISLHFGPVLAPDPALALEVAIKAVKPELVVIDSAQRLMKFRDINDYAEVTTAFEPYVEMARVYNVHICFLHHLGKEQHASNVSDGILGSTGLFASVDLALIMVKKGDVRTIQTDGPQRFGINVPETVLKYDPETELVTAGGELAVTEREERRQGILDALGDLKLSMADIKKAVGGDGAKVHSDVLGMHKDGFIDREGSGKSGDPYLYSVRQPPEDVRPNGKGYQHVDEPARGTGPYAPQSDGTAQWRGATQ